MNKPLITKYRPDDFGTFIGNKKVVESLKAMIGGDTCPHAFMFEGDSGCGKTTLARIVAKHLGAVGMGIKEMNGSDQNGIDAARQMVKDCSVKAPGSKSVVLIIDEAHRLTADSQNCLLKFIEEPPYFAYVILCTTDPKKIIKTLKSRLTTSVLKPFSADEAVEYLVDVCEKESIDTNNDVLKVVLQASGGAPRLLLNNLDRVRACKTDKEAMSCVVMSDDADFSLYQDFMKLFYTKDTNLIMKRFMELLDEGHEPMGLVQGILNMTYKKSLLKDTGKNFAHLIMRVQEMPYIDKKTACAVVLLAIQNQ